MTCFLRLTVTDDDSATNTTFITIGLDNTGKNSTLDLPHNNTYITSETQIVNGSAVNSGSNLSCLEFSAFYNNQWQVINTDCSAPYSYNWDLSGISDQANISVRVRKKLKCEE